MQITYAINNGIISQRLCLRDIIDAGCKKLCQYSNFCFVYYLHILDSRACLGEKGLIFWRFSEFFWFLWPTVRSGQLCCHCPINKLSWIVLLASLTLGSACQVTSKAFEIVFRKALKKSYVLPFKELFCTAGIPKPHEIITYFFSVSLSVSFCMFPCSKGHFIRAYLDTI